ncbi:alpha-2-macroglobulin family protein [Thalassomonas haliotis]|uniref:Alpha-2-macroglobulin n=1 Tax=Thalassomonas haliotis TaxID=485448 RepID=A0ABY7VFY9_9GAMM|nr:alpha-2-macroglobulin [Thalassomonas haliotis]WDE12614.1 alpha-2-macroglobulin family protein [Thalassomonas haliotis]
MKNKLVTLMLAWALVFLGCGLSGCSEEKASEAGQEKTPDTALSKGLTAKEPSEPAFNREQVLRDYQNTPLEILDVSERNKDGKNAIAVTLSVPLDPAESHQDYFNISTKKHGASDGAWVVSASGKTVWFPYVEPQTSYDVTIYQGLTAANGQALGKTKNTSVKTSRLEPSINFDTTGAFLTQGLGNGLPVVSVNVEQVDINFFRVQEKERQRFLREIANHNYYWGVERLSRLGELVYSGRYQLDVPKNTRAKRSIDIEGISELAAPGMYLAVMAKAGGYEKHQVMWFSVTDIGLHARFYDNQLDVYASSLTTGKALSQIEVSLVNRKGEILQQNLTSPDGQASFASNLSKASLILAKNQQHFSLIEVNKPALDLSDFDLGQRPAKPRELFIYAPRDLYRPGDQIDFNALLRDQDGRLTPNSVLSAAIIAPDGNKIKTFKWQGNKENYYHYPWQIPANAQLGLWQLKVKNIGSESFSFDFKVEEFLPERLKLTFNPQAPATRAVASKKGKFTLQLLGEYLFGAPASGNRLSTEISTSLWRNPVSSLPKFEFGDIRQSQFNTRFKLKDIQLDDNGLGQLSYPVNWPELNSPLRVKFISSLFESGGRPVSRTYSGLVWPSEQLLGIRTSFGDNNPEANSTVSFEIVKATLDGSKHAASKLDIKLIREDRRYFWVYSEHEGWHYQWNDNEYVELSKSLDIKAGSSGQVNFPVAWGNYRLEVRDPVDKLLTSTQFYAGWNWYQDWQNSQKGSGAARPDKVTMALDKAAYQGGDTVKVNIIPPEAGEAIIMVEGDSPLWLKRLTIPAEGSTIEIPVSKNWQQHNLYISALVLQPGNMEKSLTPKRSFGLVHLPLQREPRKLPLSFKVADKALPNKPLPVTVKLDGLSDNPQATKDNPAATDEKVFVTLAAVDVGVLSISDFDTPDPFEAFFGQRRYSVDSRDVYNKIIELSQADKARLRFGGDGDLSRGGQQPPSDVQIVSLFSGPVPFNDNGEADISLDIPDFNGRLRLMALAFSDDKFGQAEQEVTIAAPVVTQFAMPRFLANGDKTSLALDITNLSGELQELSVALTASGPVAFTDKASANKPATDNSQTQTLLLKDGEKTTLSYPLQATDIHGQARFALNISGKTLEEEINRQWSLGLRPPYPATIRRLQKVLHQGQVLTQEKSVIDDLLSSTVQASMSISPKADINLQNQLDQLLQYPYGCLEQTSSRAYPLIFATPAQQSAFGLKAITEDKRLAMVNKGIERLATLQLTNGGYGLWNKNSNEEYWLTAYVGDFLLNARDMGFSVPEEMLSRTLKRLQRYLSRTSHFYDEPWSDNAGHYYIAYKAYAAYVLSRVNQAPLGTLRTLAKNHSKNAKSGLAQLHLAIAMKQMGDGKGSKTLVTKALGNLPKQRRKYLADYGSQLRDLALMIHLLLTHELEREQAIALSFTLAEQVNERQYLSTQERNALFLAGMALKAVDGDNWSAEVLIGQAKTKLSQTSVYQSPLSAAELEQGIVVASTHRQPLLSNINISGYGKQAPKASANGLNVQRQWLNIQGQEISPQKAKVGDLMLVHLQLSASQRSPDVLVVDLLPAGFELENQNLEHALKLDEIKVEGKTITQWQKRNPVKHQEFRDDRYVAAVELHKSRPVHLFYLARAVTPGVYQVPPPLAEDMYRPEIRAVGETVKEIAVVQR